MLTSRLRPLLGTFVAMEVEITDGGDPVPAIEAAYSAISEVDRLMHPTRNSSDLARISMAPTGTSVEVHGWTTAVLELARQMNRDSGGAFDPCLPDASGRMPDVALSGSRVICARPAAIDLGGIAKGFAVDRAVDELVRHGATAGLVNAGGDLRVFGPTPRVIELRTPDGRTVAIELRDGALAVSGRSDDSPAEHRGFYHGASGAQVEGRLVAISAHHAAIADALCKCALLCAPGLLERLLLDHGAKQIL